jgi:hypothetical protein
MAPLLSVNDRLHADFDAPGRLDMFALEMLGLPRDGLDL